MYVIESNLRINSKLDELPSYRASLSIHALGCDVAALFQQNMLLPGVIVFNQNNIVGIIPRTKFYEKVGKPFGVEIYMNREINLLLENIVINPIILPHHLGIIEAAQIALSRNYDSVYEPIIVQFSELDFRIIDVYTLLIAQSKILKLMYEKINNQIEMMESLNKATNSLVSTLDLSGLYENILTSALFTLSVADKGAVYIFDDKRNNFGICAYHGDSPYDYENLEHINFLTTSVTQIGNEYQNNHCFISTTSNYSYRVYFEDDKTSIALPFSDGKRVYGALLLEKSSNIPFTDEEIKLLSIFCNAASAALQNAMLHEEVKQLAITDALTGLLNRRGFYQIATVEIERAKRYKRPLSLLMIDIDHFKSINDKYGHDVGDLVIKTMGKICKENTRSSDISCRFGGEEFLILLPENETLSTIQFATRLCKLVANTSVETQHGNINFTVSIGVVQISENQPDDIDSLIDCADKAMYAAKVLGRNRVIAWEDIRSFSPQRNLLPDHYSLDSEDVVNVLEQVSATLQQKEAEFKILESAYQINEAKLSAILQGAAEAILSINYKEIIIMFNQAAEKIFQYSAQEILGKPLTTILPAYSEDIKQLIQSETNEASHYTIETTGLRKNGEEIIIEANISKFFENGKSIITMFLSDITDKKEHQRRLQEAHIALTTAYDETIKGWARALELRDIETYGHSARVVETTLRLCNALGLPDEEIIHIRRGALLHDIGKMGVPDKILLKPGPLSNDEWEIMKQHPIYGYELLYPISFLRSSLDIVLYHHEKWDGTGYPEGLKGEDIPLAARIFALSDVWDALRNKRRYSPAWDDKIAADFILQNAGKHFDPNLVALFNEVIIKKIPLI